jgi:hypothetical protein
MTLRASLCAVALGCLAIAATAAPTISVIAGEQMRLDLAGSSVASGGVGTWNLTLQMQADNGTHPDITFRRWWHCQIANLTPGDVLNIQVTNAGYADVIQPVWALSTDGGSSFGDYQRISGVFPSVSGGGPWTHSFSVAVPASVDTIRLAKYFPYTIGMYDTWRNSLSSPHLTVVNTGTSNQGRTMWRLDITDSSVSDAGKHRVWIHAAVHCAETTAYYAVEGLVNFLLSGDPQAEILLGHTIFNIVPMANPDGVYLGNYRVTAPFGSFTDGVNLENEWASPYTSTVPEIVVLRTDIEGFMGTPGSPGANPIELLLNLHSSHNVAFPFHFQHTSNPFWSSISDPGVIPAVNALEGNWISAFMGRSPFAALGSTQGSALNPPRIFVESMMHDRWSSDPAWTPPKVMAITYEGTYGAGPDGSTPNTPDDYRLNGQEMALAIADFFGVTVPAELTRFSQN